MNWLNGNAPAIQAVSAIAIAVLTYFLAKYAYQSIKRTDKAIELSRDQLKTQQDSLELLKRQNEDQQTALQQAREEFDREWQPELRVLVHRTNPQDVKLDLVNLGRTAIQVQSLDIGVGHGTSLRVKSLEWIRLVPINESRGDNIHALLIQAMTEQLGITLGDSDGDMAVRVRYFSAGASHETEWTRFGVVIRRGSIDKITPMQ
ncbi:MAG TPA: hypothetical protein VL913_00695 [Candidatus Micrarchaeaceae archaeon]|nr:hypothetical protein [Candidatus Micrarchaeaceae archaeon]